jgi:hypothetical protein
MKINCTKCNQEMELDGGPRVLRDPADVFHKGDVEDLSAAIARGDCTAAREALAQLFRDEPRLSEWAESARYRVARAAPSVEAAAIGELILSSADWRQIKLARIGDGAEMRFAVSIRYDVAGNDEEGRQLQSCADDRTTLISAVVGAFEHKAQRQAALFPDKFGTYANSPRQQPALA